MLFTLTANETRSHHVLRIEFFQTRFAKHFIGLLIIFLILFTCKYTRKIY